MFLLRQRSLFGRTSTYRLCQLWGKPSSMTPMVHVINNLKYWSFIHYCRSDMGQVKHMRMGDRIKLAKLIVALAGHLPFPSLIATCNALACYICLRRFFQMMTRRPLWARSAVVVISRSVITQRSVLLLIGLLLHTFAYKLFYMLCVFKNVWSLTIPFVFICVCRLSTKQLCWCWIGMNPRCVGGPVICRAG